MNITGLDITLRRISSIENQINTLSENDNVSGDFKEVLNNSLNTLPVSGNLPILNDLPSGVKFDQLPEVFNTSRSEIESLIKKYSKENSLDESLVRSIVKQESGFNPNAKSPVGAVGLMQLMPATAKSLGVDNPFNPEQNISGGTKYLKGLMDRFDGNKELAVAAYNAGPNAVKKYGGIPPYRETQNYVKRVLGG